MYGGSTTGNSVEVFIPSTGSQCSLPDLPGPGASAHIQDGNLLCGGDHHDGCYSWTNGRWELTPSVINRQLSMSETLEEGIMVLGGYGDEVLDTILVLDKDLSLGEPLFQIYYFLSKSFLLTLKLQCHLEN